MLFVHNAVSSVKDFEMLDNEYKEKPHFTNSKLQTPNCKLFLCTCPNANLYIENRLPDYSFWKNYPDQICIGTDSLASNHQLSILEEMKTIQKHDPSISTEQLIHWATLNGAKFFGWENELGSIEVGKKPGLNLIKTNNGFSSISTSNVVRLI